MGVRYYGQYLCFDTEADVLATIGRAGDVAFAINTGMRYKYDGTNWFPTDATRILRGSLANVNLMATGSTKILTLPPTSFRFIPLGVHAEILTLTGTVVTQPMIAVGATSPNYADIAASQLLNSVLSAVGLTSTGALTIAAARAALAGSTDVFVKVNATPIGPSVYTARFDLLGYFEV